MSTVSDRLRELVVVTRSIDSREVVVEVRDSGLGLDATDRDILFRSFYTTKANGTGMGLAISRSIVEAHGGHIEAAQNQPYGAVFRPDGLVLSLLSLSARWSGWESPSRWDSRSYRGWRDRWTRCWDRGRPDRRRRNSGRRRDSCCPSRRRHRR